MAVNKYLVINKWMDKLFGDVENIRLTYRKVTQNNQEKL